jgi:hypothetical protein
VIVKCEPLSNLTGRVANDGIKICVVVRSAAEDVDANCTLLQFLPTTLESLLYYISQQGWVPLAVAEV